MTHLTNTSPLDKSTVIAGGFYGFAFGDSWGYVTEFKKYDTIMALQPNYPSLLVVSDDTQMGLYNIRAMQEISELDLTDLANDFDLQTTVRKIFAEEHVNFFYDKDNTRAPGTTCMTALAAYERSYKFTGKEGSDTNNSKGCGTVMRAPWLGFLPYSKETITYLSILQSETTHGSPTVAIASALTALVMKEIFDGTLKVTTTTTGDYITRVVMSMLSDIESYDSTLILDNKDGIRAMQLCLLDFQVSYDSFATADPESNICDFFGEGWVGDEAFICALAAFTLYGSQSSYAGIKRLVYSSGDSDSIAAIGGGFLIAHEATKPGNKIENFSNKIDEMLELRYSHEIKDAVAWLSSLK